MQEQPIRRSLPVPLLFRRSSGKDAAKGQCRLLCLLTPSNCISSICTRQPVFPKIIYGIQVHSSRMPMPLLMVYIYRLTCNSPERIITDLGCRMSRRGTYRAESIFLNIVQIMKIFRFRHYEKPKFLGQCIGFSSLPCVNKLNVYCI